ncbi:hypothetical protein RJ55_05460 [Drechmeria coniospora]|nr:hypothetical protein RJ55_05460 [Drechmeria coniospora]
MSTTAQSTADVYHCSIDGRRYGEITHPGDYHDNCRLDKLDRNGQGPTGRVSSSTSAATQDGTGRSRAITITTVSSAIRMSTVMSTAANTHVATSGSARNWTTTITITTFTVTCPVAPTVITTCGQEYSIDSPGTKVLVATSTITVHNPAACKECAEERPTRGKGSDHQAPGKSPATRTPCPTCTPRRASDAWEEAEETASLVGKPAALGLVELQGPEVVAVGSSTARLSRRIIGAIALLLITANMF